MIENYKELRQITKEVEIAWKNVRGIAPDSVADKMDNAMLSWITELTNALDIWIQKGIALTDGELILARVNLGALVECWLKFFYCVYYEDYLKNPEIKKGKIIEPDKMSFEKLKEFSLNILWENRKNDMYLWVNKVQQQRNSIHAFSYRDIGTSKEFLEDVNKFCEFVNSLINRLPSVEEAMC